MFQNELGPVNEIEFIIYIVFLLGSIFFNFLIFGDVLVIFENLIKESSIIQDKLDQANSIMKWINLDDEHQDMIREYFLLTQGSQDS